MRVIAETEGRNVVKGGGEVERSGEAKIWIAKHNLSLGLVEIIESRGPKGHLEVGHDLLFAVAQKIDGTYYFDSKQNKGRITWSDRCYDPNEGPGHYEVFSPFGIRWVADNIVGRQIVFKPKLEFFGKRSWGRPGEMWETLFLGKVRNAVELPDQVVNLREKVVILPIPRWVTGTEVRDTICLVSEVSDYAAELRETFLKLQRAAPGK
jgi:hypothetical protein